MIKFVILYIITNMIWACICMHQNNGWYRHLVEVNEEWSEFCKKIIHEAYEQKEKENEILE